MRPSSLNLTQRRFIDALRSLAKARDEMAAGLDGERPEPEKVLLYLMDRALHEAPKIPDATSGEAKKTADRARPSPYTVVFSQCTSCHRAAVETSAGRVEVEPESLARFLGSAETVVIDPESALPPGLASADAEEPAASRTVVPEEDRAPRNSGKIRREVRARAGGRCENPYCRLETRGGGHAHHIVWRSAGGATELSNEVHVCERCHSLIHAGALALEGHPIDGLRWTPRAADLTREIRRELDKSRGLPEVRWVVDPSAGQNPPTHSASPESEREQAAGQEPTVADAIAALHGLGFSEAQARERTLRAWSRLEEERRERGSREVDAGCLIKEALRR